MKFYLSSLCVCCFNGKCLRHWAFSGTRVVARNWLPSEVAYSQHSSNWSNFWKEQFLVSGKINSWIAFMSSALQLPTCSYQVSSVDSLPWSPRWEASQMAERILWAFSTYMVFPLAHLTSEDSHGGLLLDSEFLVGEAVNFRRYCNEMQLQLQAWDG